MTEKLTNLREFESLNFESYLQYYQIQLITERLLELIIQSSLDINEHILTKGFNFEAKTNKESFLKMGEFGVIEKNLAIELSKSASMRNILVHQYLEIDQHIVFICINKALNEYPFFILQIQQFLESN